MCVTEICTCAVVGRLSDVMRQTAAQAAGLPGRLRTWQQEEAGLIVPGFWFLIPMQTICGPPCCLTKKEHCIFLTHPQPYITKTGPGAAGQQRMYLVWLQVLRQGCSKSHRQPIAHLGLASSI